MRADAQSSREDSVMQGQLRRAGRAGAALALAIAGVIGSVPAAAHAASLLVEADWVASKLADRHLVGWS